MFFFGAHIRRTRLYPLNPGVTILTCFKHILHLETSSNDINATTKVPLGLIPLGLWQYKTKKNSPFLGKREGKQRNERVTP
jgi:hypothetical protein